MYWNEKTYQLFLTSLLQSADVAYKQFNDTLLASALPSIGLRIPFLRATAKKIAKQYPSDFLSICGTTYHEERLLYALVACTLPYPDFLPHSDHVAEHLVENWAICDTFCNSVSKTTAPQKADYFLHIATYLNSPNPWAIRTGIVLMLSNYLEEGYITSVLARTCAIRSDFYYVQMAQAWLLATAWAKFPQQTKISIEQSTISIEVLHKFVQKARESHRISKEDKALLKAFLLQKKT